jgi:putative addiction module killer protein
MSETRTWKVMQTRAAKAWIEGLDPVAKGAVLSRIDRMKDGNFSDTKRLKGHPGLFEARIVHGGGVRVYYAEFNGVIVIVLLGGDKGTQDVDIAAAGAALKWLQNKDVEEKAAAAYKVKAAARKNTLKGTQS